VATEREDKPAPVPNHALIRLMADKGLDDEQLAKAAKVLPKTVGRWREGTSRPYKTNGLAAAAALGAHPGVLWPHVFGPPQDNALATGEVAAETADLTAAYLSRSEFLRSNPPEELFGAATEISVSGLSLNLLCQHYPDTEIARLLQAGTSMRCLFLDATGRYIADREAEEGHSPGVLSTLTTLNIRTLQRIQARLPHDAATNLQIRTYNEPVRFNITIVDSATCIVQPYLPHARGVESPVLLIEKRDDTPGLFAVFASVFDYYWNRGKPVTS
jgi:lambda repressor-like predicted transcriptional regulator